jgi:nicotinamide mononucleotide transporter
MNNLNELMENVVAFFSKDNIFINIMNYPMSWVELLGTIFNLSAVWLSAKEKISSWVVGLVGVILFFSLFYQFNLYADMTLQVFFFFTNCIGWYQWTNPEMKNRNKDNQLIISLVNINSRFKIGMGIVFGTLFLGRFFSHIHEYLPMCFPQPAAFPYADSFIMAASIAAQILLMSKKLESWLLWIIVNIVAVIVYAEKEMYLTSLLYMLFLAIAYKGFSDWKKKYTMIKITPKTIVF